MKSLSIVLGFSDCVLSITGTMLSFDNLDVSIFFYISKIFSFYFGILRRKSTPSTNLIMYV